MYIDYLLRSSSSRIFQPHSLSFFSFYDRIVCALASLSGKKYGVHRDVVFVHAKSLEESEFKLKISIGISASSYTHCAKFPLFGTGQGSTNFPMIWTFVSSVFFDTHAKHYNGMVFSSPTAISSFDIPLSVSLMILPVSQVDLPKIPITISNSR